MSDATTTITEEDLLSSLERARADIEIIQSCYPDEISSSSSCDESSSFPFRFTLELSSLPGHTNTNTSSNLTLELEAGYPASSGVRVANYRTGGPKEHKARLEAVVRAVRRVSSEYQQEQTEGCIACCAVALETWNDNDCDYDCDCDCDCDGNQDKDDATGETETSSLYHNGASGCESTNRTTSAIIATSTTTPPAKDKHYEWTSGEPLFDRKSSFQAHVCRVHSEHEVREALSQFLTSSSKIQRATHNMYAWRIAERVPIDGGGNHNHSDRNDNNNPGHPKPDTTRVVIKHDNDDDGEDAAGSKLAFLLAMRKDENVLVVVSRWYGGIHLGPKRFAHIVNVARELLVEYAAAHAHAHQAPAPASGRK